jgi:putative transposase
VFTVALAERRSRLLTDNTQGTTKCVPRREAAHLFKMDAIVILADDSHCIGALPEGDDDVSTRWQQVKAAFSQQLPRTERRSQGLLNKGEWGIWQHRFWERAIRGDADYQRHVDYIHYNPSQAWLCHVGGAPALFIVSPLATE